LQTLLKGRGLLLLVIAVSTLLALPASTVAGVKNAVADVDKVKADPILIWVNWGEEYKEDFAYEEGVVVTYRIFIIETYRDLYGVLCVSAWDLDERNTMFVRVLKGGEEVAYDEGTYSDYPIVEWPFSTFGFFTVQVGYKSGSFPAYFHVYLCLELRGE